MASKKTPVIERIFFGRFDPAAGALADELVTLVQVEEALRETPGLSARNPANFMKDIVRNRNRNKQFPQTVVDAGWTAVQDPGEGTASVCSPACRAGDRVRKQPTGSTEAREPPPGTELEPAAGCFSRTFGRSDETWLTTCVTNLDIVHTHFGLCSPLEMIGLELLQSNVKLGRAEVDAVYLGALREGPNFLVSCEMKGPKEELDLNQIERGARQVDETSAAEAAFVVPMGIQALPGGLIWIVEFAPDLPPLAKVSEGVYKPLPAVKGIG